MNLREFMLYAGIILIMFGVFYVGINIGQDRKGDYEENKFTLEYLNESNEEMQVRYKYILSFETSGSFEAPIDLTQDKPLFTLFKDSFPVNQATLKDKGRSTIPEVSNSILLKPNKSAKANFVVSVNEDVQDVQNLIRFETTVIVEELKNKRWTPVYQVLLMKRDKYWSLNKGPIEYIKNISN